MTNLNIINKKAVSFGSTLAERNTVATRDVFQMPDARLTAPIEVMNNHHYLARIVWDTPSKEFILRRDCFTGVMKVTYDNYKETPILQGTVLNKQFIEGAVVDQVNQKILLPDGRSIDGPTGNVLSLQGDVQVYGNKEEALKAKKENISKNC
jgi:hypothetical protein